MDLDGSYTFTGLAPGSAHSYYVQANNEFQSLAVDGGYLSA